MKRTIALIMAVLLIGASFCACAGGNPLVGKWSVSEEGIEMILAFNDDGTGTISAAGILNYDFTYSTEGSKLTLVYEDEPAVCEYSIDGDKLTVEIDGESLVFTKK